MEAQGLGLLTQAFPLFWKEKDNRIIEYSMWIVPPEPKAHRACTDDHVLRPHLWRGLSGCRARIPAGVGRRRQGA